MRYGHFIQNVVGDTEYLAYVPPASTASGATQPLLVFVQSSYAEPLKAFANPMQLDQNAFSSAVTQQAFEAVGQMMRYDYYSQTFVLPIGPVIAGVSVLDHLLDKGIQQDALRMYPYGNFAEKTLDYHRNRGALEDPRDEEYRSSSGGAAVAIASILMVVALMWQARIDAKAAKGCSSSTNAEAITQHKKGKSEC